jgi:hypothetical protein
MKKIAIIAAITLTTGLTALSISKKENKAADVKVKLENTNLINKAGAGMTLATAD